VGKEDPVEFDSSAAVRSDMEGVAQVEGLHVSVSAVATMKYHYLQSLFAHRVARMVAWQSAPSASTGAAPERVRDRQIGERRTGGGRPAPHSAPTFPRPPFPPPSAPRPAHPLTGVCGDGLAGEEGGEARGGRAWWDGHWRPGTRPDGEFGWGGTPVRRERRCPQVPLSMNRNHAWEGKAKNRVDVAIGSADPERASVA